MTRTQRYVILIYTFDSYQPRVKDAVGGRQQGALNAQEDGKATAYGIMQLEDRGVIFVEPGPEIYGGMIVGAHNRDNELTINIKKEKKLTKERYTTKEHNVT